MKLSQDQPFRRWCDCWCSQSLWIWCMAATQSMSAWCRTWTTRVTNMLED